MAASHPVMTDREMDGLTEAQLRDYLTELDEVRVCSTATPVPPA